MTPQGLNPDEPLYIISVAARMVGLHPQTLRHYEKIGLVEPARTEGGSRLYSPRDIERLQKITRLVDDLGVNLAGVEVILNMTKQIEELQAELDRVEAHYQVEIERLRRAMLEDRRRRRLRLPEPSSASSETGP